MSEHEPTYGYARDKDDIANIYEHPEHVAISQVTGNAGDYYRSDHPNTEAERGQEISNHDYVLKVNPYAVDGLIDAAYEEQIDAPARAEVAAAFIPSEEETKEDEEQQDTQEETED